MEDAGDNSALLRPSRPSQANPPPLRPSRLHQTTTVNVGGNAGGWRGGGGEGKPRDCDKLRFSDPLAVLGNVLYYCIWSSLKLLK